MTHVGDLVAELLVRYGVTHVFGQPGGQTAALYDGLARINPTPVVELNRGVATAQAFGPEAGLEIVMPLFEEPGMRDYHHLSAVAGDLLCRAGEHEQAREHFLRAAAMTQNSVERTTMQDRAARCAAAAVRNRPGELQLGRLARARFAEICPRTSLKSTL